LFELDCSMHSGVYPLHKIGMMAVMEDDM